MVIAVNTVEQPPTEQPQAETKAEPPAAEVPTAEPTTEMSREDMMRVIIQQQKEIEALSEGDEKTKVWAENWYDGLTYCQYRYALSFLS